jgi:hypothetical protein
MALTPQNEHQALQDATERLAKLCDLLTDAIQQSKWNLRCHAETETPALALLTLAHARSVALQARADLPLLFPAAAAARSAYEATVTSAWMVQPDHMAGRDERWLRFLADEKWYWEQMVAEFASLDTAAAGLMAAEVKRVDDIIQDAKKPLGLQVDPSRIPGIEAMLRDLGKRDKHYFMYRHTSQLVHPTGKALSHLRSMSAHGYRDSVGTYAYRTLPGEWSMVIGLAAEAVMFCGETLAGRLDPPARIDKEGLELWESLAKAVQALAAAS